LWKRAQPIDLHEGIARLLSLATANADIANEFAPRCAVLGAALLAKLLRAAFASKLAPTKSCVWKRIHFAMAGKPSHG
ncbi:hypothetical protein, partial [Pseudomonas sp. PIC25]|uniref:hypothetical protein n=1 Tax=Pseudomonas sp. PIC25 TaxID=1958773 RepID=UPI001C486ECA